MWRNANFQANARLIVQRDELAVVQRANATSEVLEVVGSRLRVLVLRKCWQRHDRCWRTYRGRIDNLKLPEDGNAGSFMLYSAGIGTQHVIAGRFDEVEQITVEALGP